MNEPDIYACVEKILFQSCDLSEALTRVDDFYYFTNPCCFQFCDLDGATFLSAGDPAILNGKYGSGRFRIYGNPGRSFKASDTYYAVEFPEGIALESEIITCLKDSLANADKNDEVYKVIMESIEKGLIKREIVDYVNVKTEKCYETREPKIIAIRKDIILPNGQIDRNSPRPFVIDL